MIIKEIMLIREKIGSKEDFNSIIFFIHTRRFHKSDIDFFIHIYRIKSE